MKKIVFVCLGNICRSPMAEFVMKDLTNQYEIESRATSNWEHGNPIHKGLKRFFAVMACPMMCLKHPFKSVTKIFIPLT